MNRFISSFIVFCVIAFAAQAQKNETLLTIGNTKVSKAEFVRIYKKNNSNLYNETESIELHLAHLELIQNEYTNEDKTQVYREALNDISTHSNNLEKEIADLKQKVQQLKKRISNNLLRVTKS